MLKRVLSNTAKQIRRSGWVAWSSVAVMALAFFIASIFVGIAFLSNGYIRFIETRDNLVVFFEVGIDLELVDDLKEKWSELPQVKEISYFTEEQAYEKFLADTEWAYPVIHALLQERTEDEKKLESSLDIRLNSLDELAEIKDVLVGDILAELDKMGYEYDGASEPPIDLQTDDDSLNEFKEVFTKLRIGGAIVLSLLFVVVFFFTLMTVEFRTYNRMEEIGVMQLVGGSLGYIRAPYILEGAFYGVMGALVSSAIILVIVFSLVLNNPASQFSVFVYERLSPLDLPTISPLGWGLVVLVKVAIGFLIGSFSSFLAIRKYIR